MTAPRRVGAETSKTRAAILESTERLMIDEGYAAVTYRAVAARAGVTSGLVQYYFPTLDDLFVTLLRQRSERNIDRLIRALADRESEPIRVVWEFGRDETTAALMLEFMALGNHRKSIQAEIAASTERARNVQLQTLTKRWQDTGLGDDRLTPGILLFLLAGIPKFMLLEEAFGVTATHAEVHSLVEEYLDAIEPQPTRTPVR